MKKIKKLTDEEIWAAKEAEKMEILQNANQPKGQLNVIDNQGNLGLINEIKQITFSDTDDPDKKHAIYYKEIEKLLKQILNPKVDKETKKAFQILREEKNIFLTRGKRKDENGIRGRDARMAYVTDMETAANIIYENIAHGSNPLELYISFRDKNIELGYYNDLASVKDGRKVRKDVNANEAFEKMKDKV